MFESVEGPATAANPKFGNKLCPLLFYPPKVQIGVVCVLCSGVSGDRDLDERDGGVWPWGRDPAKLLL